MWRAFGPACLVPRNRHWLPPSRCAHQACKNLNMNQAERRASDAETAGKIDAFIQVRGWRVGCGPSASQVAAV